MKMCLILISNIDPYPAYEKNVFFPRECMLSFLQRCHLKKSSATLTELAK